MYKKGCYRPKDGGRNINKDLRIHERTLLSKPRLGKRLL